MKFDLEEAIALLSRTPEVLRAQLAGTPGNWLTCNEGPGTWSPREIVAHLIVNEETNFLPRSLLILSDDGNKMLTPIDMQSHFEKSRNADLTHLLSEFSELRQKNIATLRSLRLSDEDLTKTAMHPKVGLVCLSNVLSTWVAHDLSHIGQIVRVMAKQYRQEIGPFMQFLPRLQ